jgi:peptidylprolyl isomerase
MRPFALLAAVLCACALAIAGCGSSGGAKDTGPSKAPAAAAPAAPIKPTGALAHKPKVKTESGAVPKKLVVDDLIQGKGPAAKSGDTLSVQYVGVLNKNGKEFDSSWKTGQPFEFQLGVGMVIPGWDKGVEGLKVGGRRRLVIPSDLAYGAQGSPPTIGPDEPLVFVIDLVGIR